MKVEKTTKDNKILLVIAIVILCCLLGFIIIRLKGNDKPTDYKSMNCILEEDEIGETTSNISFKYTDDKISSLTFNYLYVYNDNDYLLSLKYESEKDNIEILNKVNGINTSINYDPTAFLLEIRGSVDYSKIDSTVELEKPYSVLARKDLTKSLLTTYLKDEGYTCEEANK